MNYNSSQTKRIVRGLLAIFTVPLLGACEIEESSLPLEREEVLGKYHASYLDNAEEYITLNADSTYEHTYQPLGDSLRVQTGTWELTLELNRADRPRLRFKEFVNWYPLDLNCYDTGPRSRLDTLPRGWIPYIKKRKDGVIRIVRCPNQRQFYVLENSQPAANE